MMNVNNRIKNKSANKRCQSWVLSLCVGLLVLIGNSLSSELKAAAYNNNTSHSWHWYHDKALKKKTKKQKRSERLVPFDHLSAHQQVQILHYYTINAVNEATLYPSQAHQMNYVKWQNFWTSHASSFTQQWQELNLMHPELNYAARFSTMNAAAGLYSREHNQKEDTAINQLSKQYGLIFFYKKDVGFSAQMAKLVSNFAKRYGFALIPVSIDGAMSPFLPNTKLDHGQAHTMHAKIFPSLYLVNPATGQYKPVFYKYTALDQLRQNLLNIATNWKRDW